MRILVIEDEIKTAQSLQQGLSEAGFEVDVANDGEAGLLRAEQSSYDLLILDVMMPKKDGWAVITELRNRNKQTLTLMLTARDQLDDRVKGLNLGADAYLIKPFAFPELVALVKSLLRRSTQQNPEALHVADLQINFFQRKVLRQGRLVDLTPKEFSILGLLARRKGEIISRSVLAEQVWGINFESETNVVDVHMRRLRSKIDDPFGSKLIHTVRGMGYVLREPASA